MQTQIQQADPMASTIAQALRILAECGRQRRQKNAELSTEVSQAKMDSKAGQTTPDQRAGGLHAIID